MSDFDLVRKKKAIAEEIEGLTGPKLRYRKVLGRPSPPNEHYVCSSGSARPSLHMSMDDV